MLVKEFRLGPAWGIVAAFVAVGCVFMGFRQFQIGGFVIAAAFIAAAAMRGGLPERYTRDIAIRTSSVDMGLYGGLAVSIIVAAMLLKT